MSYKQNSPIPVSEGGLGDSTLTNHAVLVGAGTSPINQLAVGSNGQVLVGSNGSDPVFAAITSTGGSITFSAGPGTLNMEVSGGSVSSWTDVSGTSQQMAINAGYAANNGSLVTLTLPTTAAIGSFIVVTGKGAGGWKVAQNSGQTIYFGNLASTTGATGFIASTLQRDVVYLRCVSTDNDWQVESAVGNITVS